MEKLFLKKFLKSIFSDTFEVQFWDGTGEKFGEGDIKFKIIINEHLSKSDILKDPFLTFGEAYMNNIIDFEGNIQEVIESVYKNKDSFLHKAFLFEKLYKITPHSIKNSKNDIKHHYDLGNDFYKLWLDKTMNYSCSYFKSKEDSLYQAQLNKVDHILKKLNLHPEQKLLDIGCGWGDLIITAAKKYNVKALGITLSNEQFNKVNERIKENHLEDQVEVRLLDYRELSLLHCITAQTESEANQWIKNYIFPGGYIPSIRELVYSMAENDLHLIDLESLRLHYCKTLECWAKNFEASLDEVKKLGFDDKFIRMWRLYLNSCAASFHYGVIDLHQFLLTKGLDNEIPMTRDYLYK